MFLGLGHLTAREKEVAALTAKGLSNKEIAELLFVTEKTIKFHLTNIYRSSGVNSRAQLIVAILRDYPTSSEIDHFLSTIGRH